MKFDYFSRSDPTMKKVKQCQFYIFIKSIHQSTNIVLNLFFF
uniref:Uncharacterized protein n=1 Tax=Anguilla anguilla TaxID=7936 RepID=A0A0E9XWX5_ANGAN